MARKIFYSFHYDGDCWRTSQVRNIGFVEGSQPVRSNEWESVKRGGDPAIKRWIDEQLSGRTCTVVLIGARTAEREWVKHEIVRSWEKGLGLLGVRIHGLLDSSQRPSSRGADPFASFTIGKEQLSKYAKTYEPPYTDSKQIYGYIADNLASWVENAIKLREGYR